MKKAQWQSVPWEKAGAAQRRRAILASSTGEPIYKKIENEWARALKENPPKQVSVDVIVNYEGDLLRPSSFNVSYIIDGELKVFDLVN
ncbi:DNA/RNA non-specific endonuclease [Brevibacillus formosus]|uniref:DNA/RNA non-specific endonuclease n=1 Tax=Brevibacillus formosus TaxID=54913 RepID=UPI000B5A27A8|nr:DNA/RNA non-specific endonuclease [Brevibacillus formosus]